MRHRFKARNRRSSKLTELDVKFIRHWRAVGYGQREIGEAFGVSQSHVCRIHKQGVWGGVS